MISRITGITTRAAVMVMLVASLGGCGIVGNLLGRGEDNRVNQYGVPGRHLGQLGVNGYLWRASLETIDFMPLAATDSRGGTIVTEWYAPPEVRDERLKVTVYIVDRRLRADGIRVVVFRQTKDADSIWQDAEVKAGTEKRLEDAILTRARQLRVRSLEK